MECKVCWKIFMTPQDATDHYSIFKSHENYEIYTKNKPFECGYCKVRFNTEEDLNQHKKIHEKSSPIETKPVIHTPIQVTNSKRFPRKCKKEISEEERLENERRSKNSSSYECNICGETFKHAKQLETHMAKHRVGRNEKNSGRSNRSSKKPNITPVEIAFVDTIDFDYLENQKIAELNEVKTKSEDSFFEDPDVRVVELNAKTIELSSSEEEEEEFKPEDIKKIKEEILVEKECNSFENFDEEDERYNDIDDMYNDEDDKFNEIDNIYNNTDRKDRDFEEIFDETKSDIKLIKIEKDVDDYESDDCPLDQLIKKTKLLKSKKQIKKEGKSNNAQKNGQIPIENIKKEKPVRKKRSSKKEKVVKVNEGSLKIKIKAEKCDNTKSENREFLVVQPDIVFDNKDSKQNINKIKDIKNIENPDDINKNEEEVDESGNKLPRHKCSTCGERRSNKRLLLQHKQSHNGLGETECKVCRQVFGTPQEVLSHFDSFKKEKTDKHYQEGRPYQCKDCDSRFIHLKHLYEHRKIHIGDKKYVCKLCGKSFLRKQGLQWHLETHLSDEMDAESLRHLTGVKVRDNVLNKKVFVCDMCGHEFKQSSQLKIHINRHVKLKRFTCPICSKSFVTPRDLLKHNRTHTGERPYKCSYCEKSFIDSGDKIKHERLHTGEKPYTCQTCGKKFTFSSGLRTHERAVHFGLKRYNCDSCTRGFSNKSCLLKHKAKIHLQR
ncbi:zinc finger protein 69 homolog B-like [Condylostylus longicornis]|uniref:zinc finger protein 69 homolog B-like n=1 Tax=Condylostylus longicornis TaxID=2530218 RepID=UPI00244DB857|nr:zinc finger protein 69 homolog B-like [Condylostylus longicornis]